MKARTIIALLVAGILIGALAAYFILGPKPAASAAKAIDTASGPFDAVTGRLDRGGSLYLFWDTAGLVRFCEQALDGIRTVVENQAAGDLDAQKKSLEWFQLVRRMVGETGLYRVRALGASSRPLDDQFHRTRLVLYRAPEATADLIWNLYAPQPHALAELDLLPAETAIAQFGDFRPRVIWDWIHAQAEKSGVEEFQKGVSMLAPSLKMQGIDPDAILDGFSGSAGLVVTLDRERTIQLPLGEEPAEIPAPNLALVLGVKNYTLYELAAKGIPAGAKAQDSEPVRFLSLPAPPSTVFPSPTLACDGRNLVLASSRELAETLLEGKGGLKETPGFHTLSRDLPLKGNGFRFISPRAGEVIRSIQTAALKNPRMTEKDRATLKTFLDLFPRDFSMFGVITHDADGFCYTLNHSLALHQLLVLPAVMAAGIGAAVALPNMMKSMNLARRAQTLGLMRSLSAQAAIHVTEHGSAPETIESAKDGWGNMILYRRGPGAADFALASAGADGRFEGWDQRGLYSANEAGAPNRDIIMVNGELVYGPVK